MLSLYLSVCLSVWTLTTGEINVFIFPEVKQMRTITMMMMITVLARSRRRHAHDVLSIFQYAAISRKRAICATTAKLWKPDIPFPAVFCRISVTDNFFFINSVCTIYLKVSQRITWPSHSYATHTHTQSTWTEPEQRKKPLRAQTYFCNSRSLLRSRSATSRFALLSRSIVFCHAPLHPTFGPFRSVIRSAHAPLTCSAHTCQLVSVLWNWAGQRA